MIETLKWDGKPISKPGCYSGLPLEDYHRGDLCVGPSVSSSGLRKIFNESPADYWCESPLNPDRIEQTDKRAFMLGRATHHLMLGEPFFAKLFCIQPDEYTHPKDGVKPWHNGAALCKEWAAAQKAAGRTILLPSEVEAIKGMAISLGQHPMVKAGILTGAIERSIIWRDKETGIWLKCRPDVIPTDSGNFADLKTTTSVQYLDLIYALRDWGYHQQGALVREGCKEVLGFAMEDFTLVFVQKKPPYSVRDVRLKDSDMDRGHLQNRAALRTLWRCLKNNEWPGPGAGREGTEYLELPERDQKFIDERLAEIAGEAQ